MWHAASQVSAQMAITLEAKSVFYKQRNNHMFPPSVWVRLLPKTYTVLFHQ